MKKIEVIIKKSKFNEVKEALHSIGVVFFCYWDVTGKGNERQRLLYRSIGVNSSEIQKKFLSIIIPNELLEMAVKILLKSGHTGKVGDGKIFVSDVEESFRIRTIEDGSDSLK